MAAIDENSIDIEKLGYRQGTVGVVVDKNNNFLIVQMVDYKENEWRFPGGGIDDGESPQGALLRELVEELGTSNFELIGVSQYRSQYEWPMGVILSRLRKEGETWRGQQQTHFLVKFTGSMKEIKFKKDEIRQVKWVKRENLSSHFVFPGQWEFINQVLQELLP
ncbi:MAG TPA: NUDIX domain-containing protein [Patescibacteria group bacterium]|nr:NUDIX domain-containing protein [Patescibacteria group bacterium]